MKLIEQKAWNLLEAEDLLKFPIDVVKLTERLGIKIFMQEMEDNISGLLYSKSGRPYIGVNSLHPENRRRFTVAHELGHYVLHHPKDNDVIIDKKFLIFRKTTDISGSEEKEKEANQFAAALLMPESLLLNFINESDIDLNDDIEFYKLAKKIKVSEQALTYRLLNLGVISY